MQQQIDSSENLEPPILSNADKSQAFSRGNFSISEGGQDGSLHVTFFVRPKFFCGDEEAHRTPGAPVDHIRIFHPGSKDTVERVVTPADKQRFGVQYNAWKEGRTLGKPLETWDRIPKGMVDEFRILNVYTLEQLAQASDSVVQKLGTGALELRSRAQEEVFTAKTAPVIESLKHENVELRTELDELKSQFSQLMEAHNKSEKARK